MTLDGIVFCYCTKSVIGFDNLLNFLLTDWAVLVDNFGALLTKTSVPARNHYSVNLALHANFTAIVILDVVYAHCGRIILPLSGAEQRGIN